MKSRKVWLEGCLLLLSWSVSARAFDVAVSGAVERSGDRSRVEVLATLVFPLDEWTQVTPDVVQWVNANPTFARAWEHAEANEESAAASDAVDLFWVVEPPWLGNSTDPINATWQSSAWGQGGFGQGTIGQGTIGQGTMAQGGMEQGAEPEYGPAWLGVFNGLATPTGEEPSDASGGAPREPRPNTAPPVRATRVTPPRLDRTFLTALMKACSEEFRGVRTELDDLASRARWSAWLPDLQVKGGRNTDQTLRLMPTEAEPDRYQVVGGNGVRFEGQVRWSFNQLVFARDELAVARLRGALDVERRKRQQQAMNALTKWLEAWVTLASAESDDGGRIDAWVAESAHRAELDWLSRGWFSAHVPAAPEWADVRTP